MGNHSPTLPAPDSAAELDANLRAAIGAAGLLIRRHPHRAAWFAVLDEAPGCEWGPFASPTDALVGGIAALTRIAATACTYRAEACVECGRPLLVSTLDSNRHCDECIRVHAVE